MQYINELLPESLRTTEVLSNSIAAYISALVVLVFLVLLFRLFHHFVIWRLETLSDKTDNAVDDLIIDVIKTIHGWFYVYVSFWITLFFLSVPPLVQKAADTILILLLVYQVVRAVGLVIEFFVGKQYGTTSDGQADAVVDLLSKIAKGVVWVIGFLFVLQNLGVNVTSLIAGLGVGGIAVALALQNILSDLFSSFSIYFDKPFVVGDFIQIGELMGIVEDIGIKTTRLRALSGEEIVLANRELTTARIQNYRDTTEWRGALSVGVTYDTAPETLDRVREIIREVAENIDGVRFDRANATKFADSSINFDIVFYSETTDYNEHLAQTHTFHSDLKHRFDEEGIRIAFPTRTVYLHNQS